MLASTHVQAVRRHWLLHSTLALLGGAIFGGLAASKPPEYSAEAEVSLTFVASQTAPKPTASPSPSSGPGAGAQPPGPTLPPEDPRRAEARRVMTITQMASRPPVTDAAVAQLNLPYSSEELGERIRASTPFGTKRIIITVTDPDPRLAAEIANVVAAELREAAESADPGHGQDGFAGEVVSASVPGTPVQVRWQIPAIAGLASGLVLGSGIAAMRRRLAGRPDPVSDEETTTEKSGI